jgi:flagellar motor switch protein FliM
MSSPVYLNIDELGNLLARLTISYVNQIIYDIPCHFFGGQRMYDPKEVRDWFEIALIEQDDFEAIEHREPTPGKASTPKAPKLKLVR